MATITTIQKYSCSSFSCILGRLLVPPFSIHSTRLEREIVKLTQVTDLSRQELEIAILCNPATDVSIIDDWLVLDTTTKKQMDFFSPLATEMYQRYCMNESTKIQLINDTKNELYNAVVISGGKCEVIEDWLNLDYVPPIIDNQVDESKIFRDIKPYKELPIIALDIETVGIDPNDIEASIQDNRDALIISIGLRVNGENPYLIQHSENMLNELHQFLSLYESIYGEWVISGHNIFNFDLRVLYFWNKHHGGNLKIHSSEYQKVFTYSEQYGRPMTYYRGYLNYDGCSVIDTWLLAGAEEKRSRNIESFSLKDLALNIKGTEDRRLELSYPQIVEAWNSGNIQLINEYLKYDLDDQLILTNRFLPPIYYLRKFSGMSIQELHYSSVAKIWNHKLTEYYQDKTNLKLIEPDYKLEFSGAITGFRKGLFRKVAKIDISSLYPSILLRYHLYSFTKDTDCIFLICLANVLEERLKAKERTDAESAYYSLALKILINGGYGFMGTEGYQFNSMPAAALVTAIGRKIMRLMLQVLEEHDIPIIEYDTDGIIFDTTNHPDVSIVKSLVQERLPDGINIGIDWQDAATYIHAPKNYIIFHSNGKVKRYGIFRKRNRSLMERDFPIEYLQEYLNGTHEVYYIECLIRLANNDINYVANTVRIGKAIKWLLPLGNTGERITYYCTEEKRYHKLSGKPIKSQRKPVLASDTATLWYDYYADILAKMKEDIDETILGTSDHDVSCLLDDMEEPINIDVEPF